MYARARIHCMRCEIRAMNNAMQLLVMCYDMNIITWTTAVKQAYPALSNHNQFSLGVSFGPIPRPDTSPRSRRRLRGHLSHLIGYQISNSRTLSPQIQVFDSPHMWKTIRKLTPSLPLLYISRFVRLHDAWLELSTLVHFSTLDIIPAHSQTIWYTSSCCVWWWHYIHGIDSWRVTSMTTPSEESRIRTTIVVRTCLTRMSSLQDHWFTFWLHDQRQINMYTVRVKPNDSN